MSVIYASLIGKSAWNSAEFCNHSNSRPISHWNFDGNFVFHNVKHVPADSEHVPTVLEYFPTINSSDFMHQKKFLPFFILLLKITSTCFPSKTSRCYFGGKDIADVFSEILPDASVKTMPLRFG
jgi:hypothetical protein